MKRTRSSDGRDEGEEGKPEDIRTDDSLRARRSMRVPRGLKHVPFRTLLCLAVGVAMTACKLTEARVPSYIHLASSKTVLETLGETVIIEATVLDQNGSAMPNAAVLWSIDAPGVIVVDPDGRVTALAPGRATLSARADTAVGHLGLAVDLGPTGVRVLSGISRRTGLDSETITIEVENLANPGTFVVQAWGLGLTLGSPNVMFGQTDPVQVTSPWSDSLEWSVSTGRGGSQPSVVYVVVLSRSNGATGYRESHRYDLARGVPLY